MADDDKGRMVDIPEDRASEIERKLGSGAATEGKTGAVTGQPRWGSITGRGSSGRKR